MRGCFVVQFPGRAPIRLWNTIPQEGQKVFLEALFQAVFTDLPASLYIGVCNQVPENTTTLADIDTEPTIGVGNYAREVVTRNGTDWPLIQLVNGYYMCRTRLLSYTASGADWDAPFTRLFLTNVATGFVGKLLSMSGALTQEISLLDGDPAWTAYYEIYLVSP